MAEVNHRGEDPSQLGNGLTFEPIGISRAVEGLVMVTNNLRCARQRGKTLEHTLGNLGVVAN